MKLAILGASGRTGRHLVEQALAAGHEVVAFIRAPARLSIEHERILMVQGDVTDPATVEKAIAGRSENRPDMADFMLKQVADQSYLGQAPAISNW